MKRKKYTRYDFLWSIRDDIDNLVYKMDRIFDDADKIFDLATGREFKVKPGEAKRAIEVNTVYVVDAAGNIEVIRYSACSVEKKPTLFNRIKRWFSHG